MTETNALQPTVVRTPGGLFIAGTRITLYDVMDYLAADWPPHSDPPLAESHRAADNRCSYNTLVRTAPSSKAEYQQVLQQTEDNPALLGWAKSGTV